MHLRQVKEIVVAKALVVVMYISLQQNYILHCATFPSSFETVSTWLDNEWILLLQDDLAEVCFISITVSGYRLNQDFPQVEETSARQSSFVRTGGTQLTSQCSKATLQFCRSERTFLWQNSQNRVRLVRFSQSGRTNVFR